MKLFWVDATQGESWEERKEVLTSALESGAHGALIRPEDLPRAEKLGRLTLACESDACGCVLLRAKQVVEDIGEVIKALQEAGREVAVYVEVESKRDEQLAVLAGRQADYVILVARDWKVIPLENLIAELQDERAKVVAGVRDAGEAKVALETLEVGADGVLLQSTEREEMQRVGELVAEAEARVELVKARVTEVRQAGTGDRVCIDTTSLLGVGEGMLVGGQAECLFLVHSESLESEYVASRPFRVNAGAVHAYVLTPEGRTRYLSELASGDTLLAVDAGGRGREVTVGRVKIERRPMLLVEVEAGGRRYTHILQNAETVNLVGGDGRPVSVSVLKPGDEVLVHLSSRARHFGKSVRETIIER